MKEPKVSQSVYLGEMHLNTEHAEQGLNKKKREFMSRRKLCNF